MAVRQSRRSTKNPRQVAEEAFLEAGADYMIRADFRKPIDLAVPFPLAPAVEQERLYALMQSYAKIDACTFIMIGHGEDDEGFWVGWTPLQ